MGQLSRKRKRGPTGGDSTVTQTSPSPARSTRSTATTSRRTPLSDANNTSEDNTVEDMEVIRTDDDSRSNRTANHLAVDDDDSLESLDKSQSQLSQEFEPSFPPASQRPPPIDRQPQVIQPSDPSGDDLSDDEMSVQWGDGESGSFCMPSETQLHREVDRHAVEAEQRAKQNVAECGAIEAITLHNFMCHSNFHLDFGPRINFIVGRNGSGKSAILTAIVLGLGGRASTTSRGKGVASFIKSGESQAKVILKICNWNEWATGKQGYQLDTYGKSITVERTINASGASTYKIKSDTGRTVADRKDTLDDIIRYFNIQVDNPICVLNQEVSRNFLNTKNARDKYQFFMKATLLEDMKNDYAASETDRTISTKILDQKKAVIPETTRDLKELERKVRMFNELENHKEKFANLNNEALWALVYEQQHKLETVRSQVAKLDKRLATETAKIDKEKETMAALDTDKADAMSRLNRLVDEANQSKDLVEECKQKLNQILDGKRAKERETRGVHNEIIATKNDIKGLKQKIQLLEQQYSNESHNQRKAEIARLTTEIDGLKAEEQRLIEDSDRLEQVVRDMSDEGLRVDQERNKMKSHIAVKEGDINRLKQSRVDQMKKFGPKYCQLVEAIESAHKRRVFKKKPLGPIGHHIKLRDYACALAVEKCLKGLIYGFCCDNMDDKRELDKIIRQVFGDRNSGNQQQRLPMIVTRPFGPLHDVSRNSVQHEEYKSLLDLMDIKESAIANCIIDQCQIEQILFIPDYKRAEELLMVRDSVRNCYQAYTRDGDVMHPQTRDQDYKSYATRGKQSPTILMQSVDQTLEQLDGQMATLQEQNQELIARCQSHRQAVNTKRSEREAIDNRKKRCRLETLQKDKKLKDLEAFGDSAPVEISTLEDELQKHSARMQELEESLDLFKGEISDLDADYTEADQELTAKKAAYDQLLESRGPLKASLEQIKSDLLSHAIILNDFEKKMTATETDKREELARMAAYEDEYERDLTRAKTTTGLEVLVTKRSSKTVVNEIKQMERFLNDQENSIGNKDQIYKKYKDQMDHYKRVKNEVKALEDHLGHLKQSLELRRRGYVALRDFYSMMTKFFFMDVLRHKGFSGSLEIIHNQKEVNGELKKAKTLEIKVNPKAMPLTDSQPQSQGTQRSAVGSYSDTRSLSGGERSYSTVAFILSLWESAQSPFKILDEVDVFMDLMTRKISLDTMIEFASQKSGKQYIFLSPLKLQNLPNPELIRVFQMPEPKRIDA